LRNKLHQLVQDWKQINLECNLDLRRNNEEINEMMRIQSIKDKLTNLVIEGTKLWKKLSNDKIKRKLEVEKSFM